MPKIKIGRCWVGDKEPVYFVADIAANHDGQVDRAVQLIHLAAKAGADAAKFQHFRAPKIVSKRGFESLGGQFSHQSTWKKSVYEVYQSAAVPWEWTETLKKACDEAGIDFLSTPYDIEAIDMLYPYLDAYKVGSGDITWIEAMECIASKAKPVLLATGASDVSDVERAVRAIVAINPNLVLMQCNTNYTGNIENFRYVQLRVLLTYASLYPALVLGLSDHTLGHAAVLGAVALGARVVEKHFTDDRKREGPDHSFALDPSSWREMVDRTRELEDALGGGKKRIEPNEKDTVIIQRRCLRAAHDLARGTVLSRSDVEALRPAPPDSILPYPPGSYHWQDHALRGERRGLPQVDGPDLNVLYFSRGYTTHDRRYLQSLVDAGYQVSYLRLLNERMDSRPLPERVRPITWVGDTRSFDTSFSYFWRYLSLQRILSEIRPQVVIAGPVQSSAFLVALTGYKPLVTMSWGSDVLMEADRSRWMKVITRYTLSRSAAVLGDCQAVRDKIHLLTLRQDITIVTFPWGIDLESFVPCVSRLSLRQDLGWMDKPILTQREHGSPFMLLMCWCALLGAFTNVIQKPG